MLSDLAFALAKHGHKIVVITSRQSYDNNPDKLARHETINGTEVIRVASSRLGRHNLMGRVVDYVTFFMTVIPAILKHTVKGDIVVAKTDPPLISILVAPLTWLKGARFINWLQDIFPEIATELKFSKSRLSKRFVSVLGKLRNRSLRYANANVVLGENMATKLTKSGIAEKNIHIIHNWSDGTLVSPIDVSDNAFRRTCYCENSFVVGYSGNLGRAHDYETILHAIEKIEHRHRPNTISQNERCTKNFPGNTPTSNTIVQWLFVGGGISSNALKQEITARGLTSVAFQPYQPRKILAASLSVPDLHLVSLRPELEGLIVPSKYYGVAAAGRPAIFIGDKNGEVAKIIHRSNTGSVVTPGDDDELVRQVLRYANNPDLVKKQGQNARSLFETEFDFPIALQAWEQLLSQVMSADVKKKINKFRQ